MIYVLKSINTHVGTLYDKTDPVLILVFSTAKCVFMRPSDERTPRDYSNNMLSNYTIYSHNTRNNKNFDKHT